MICTEKTVGIWFVSLTDTSDWVASVTEDADEPGAFIGEMRFRYYAVTMPHTASRAQQREDAFSGKDRKKFYDFRVKPGAMTRDEVAAKMREMANELVKAGACGPVYEVLNNTDDYEDFLCRFSEQPWVHAKKATDEEVESRIKPHMSRADRRAWERQQRKQRKKGERNG